MYAVYSQVGRTKIECVHVVWRERQRQTKRENEQAHKWGKMLTTGKPG